MFAASCREFNVDPAAAAGIDDPWLAAQLRAGLLWRLRTEEAKQQEEEEQSDLRQEHFERLDKARTMRTI